MVKVEILKNPGKQDLEGINNLLPQIAQKPHFLSLKELKEITSHEGSRVVVAREKDGRIVGMCAITVAKIPTGLITTVEDVVVDESQRGKGIGRKLTQKLIDIATKMKAKHLSLTTNPNRIAANEMYQSMGFFKKETNYYRLNMILPKPNKKPKL